MAAVDPFERRALRHCPACDHIQVEVMPSADRLRAYYTEEYSGRRGSFARRAYFRVMRRRARAQLDQFSAGDDLAGKRLLDIGCGYGVLLDEARRRGAEVVGLEFDPAAGAACRARGLDVSMVSGEDELLAKVPDCAPDLIVLSHVLEHLRDPAAILALTLPARILVEVPRYQVDVAEQFVDQEGHLHFFSVESLGHTLTRSGVIVTDIAACGPSLPEFWKRPNSLPARVMRTLTRDTFFRQYRRRNADGVWIRAVGSLAGFQARGRRPT